MADGRWVMTEDELNSTVCGFGYKSSRCKACGGTTDFVYKDEAGKYGFE